MYRIDGMYKIELKKGIYYTGKVIDESDRLFKILTTRGEELIISKEEIVQSLLIE